MTILHPQTIPSLCHYSRVAGNTSLQGKSNINHIQKYQVMSNDDIYHTEKGCRLKKVVYKCICIICLYRVYVECRFQERAMSHSRIYAPRDPVYYTPPRLFDIEPWGPSVHDIYKQIEPPLTRHIRIRRFAALRQASDCQRKQRPPSR